MFLANRTRLRTALGFKTVLLSISEKLQICLTVKQFFLPQKVNLELVDCVGFAWQHPQDGGYG